MSISTLALVAAVLAPMQARRAQFAAAVDPSGRLYVMGAADANQASVVERFDPAENRWDVLAHLQASRYGAAAWFGRDGVLRVVGGLGVAGVVSSLETFDATASAWNIVRGGDLDRQFAGYAAALDGTPYIFGGETRDMPDANEGPDTASCLRSVIRFDGARDAWVYAPSMPTRRRDLAAVTGKDGRMYALGGQFAVEPGCWVQGDTGSWYVLDAAEALDPATGSWSRLPAMPTARYGLMAAAGADGLIYAIGGATKHQRALTQVEAYDPGHGTWTVKAPLPAGRWDGAAVPGKDGRIYVLGGYDADHLPTDTVMAFDPATNSWETSEAP